MPPLAGPSAPLGRAPARRPRLLWAVWRSRGEEAGHLSAQPPPRVLELASRLPSRRSRGLGDLASCLTSLPGVSGTWTRRRRRCSRRTRATCPTPTWRCAAASRPTAEGAPGRLPPSRTACLPSWVRVGRVRNAVVAQFAVVAQLVGLVGFRHCLPSCALRCVARLSECSRGGTVPLARIAL